MIIIEVKDSGSLERALKTLKKKFEKAGTVKQLRALTEFTKPSQKRREVVLKAKYVNSKFKVNDTDI